MTIALYSSILSVTEQLVIRKKLFRAKTFMQKRKWWKWKLYMAWVKHNISEEKKTIWIVCLVKHYFILFFFYKNTLIYISWRVWKLCTKEFGHCLSHNLKSRTMLCSIDETYHCIKLLKLDTTLSCVIVSIMSMNFLSCWRSTPLNMLQIEHDY